MDHTKSFIVREYNFKCRVCTDIYNDPIILDCPCKCILCKKCLEQHWKMEILLNFAKASSHHNFVQGWPSGVIGTKPLLALSLPSLWKIFKGKSDSLINSLQVFLF